MLNILISPDSFKETLNSVEVARIIHHGFQLALHPAQYTLIPMADGGEGSLAAIEAALPITKHCVQVKGPLFKPQSAHYGVLEQDNTAIIEMAEAAGISLIAKKDRHPLNTTTYGVGELILDALNKNCRHFVITLGGSATCDAGMGALAAMGVQFKDAKHQILQPIGKNLTAIAAIDVSQLDPRLSHCKFTLAHDVDNPLLGLNGALMYAPQKGASAEDVELLHKGFENFALQVARTTDKNIGMVPGTGSAGGLAAGLFAFLNAKLTPGAEFMMKLFNFSQYLAKATIVITGEGQLDAQSLHGKTPIAIANLAKQAKIPVIAFAANIKGDYEDLYHQGITAAFSIAPGPVPKQVCKKFVKPLLMQAAYNVARLLRLTTVNSTK